MSPKAVMIFQVLGWKIQRMKLIDKEVSYRQKFVFFFFVVCNSRGRQERKRNRKGVRESRSEERENEKDGEGEKKGQEER